jgi:hypothetical protein
MIAMATLHSLELHRRLRMPIRDAAKLLRNLAELCSVISAMRKHNIGSMRSEAGEVNVAGGDPQKKPKDRFGDTLAALTLLPNQKS